MAKSRTKALKPTWEGHLKLSLLRSSWLGARHPDGAHLVDYKSYECHRGGALPA